MHEQNAQNANKSTGGRTTGGVPRAFHPDALPDFDPEIIYTRGYF